MASDFRQAGIQKGHKIKKIIRHTRIPNENWS
jgi:hypothetical protein